MEELKDILVDIEDQIIKMKLKYQAMISDNKARAKRLNKECD